MVRERTGMRNLKGRGEAENEKVERGHKSLEVAVMQRREHGTRT